MSSRLNLLWYRKSEERSLHPSPKPKQCNKEQLFTGLGAEDIRNWRSRHRIESWSLHGKHANIPCQTPVNAEVTPNLHLTMWIPCKPHKASEQALLQPQLQATNGQCLLPHKPRLRPWHPCWASDVCPHSCSIYCLGGRYVKTALCYIQP